MCSRLMIYNIHHLKIISWLVNGRICISEENIILNLCLFLDIKAKFHFE